MNGMDEKYKQDFLRAGALASEVRAFGKALIVKGASYNGVIGQIRQKIAELGARPAFPPQIALNDVAAHYLPLPGEDIVFSDQVVKLDVGICYNGAIGDCAVTIDLSGKYQALVDAAEAALLAAEKIIKVGISTCEIGRAIEQEINARGFAPVKNLSGHGLGYYRIHMPPSIPNYDDKSNAIIRPGMTFAIEPFATTGKGFIYDAGNPTIFSFLKTRPLSSPLAKKLLTKIKSFTGLPFALHDLLAPDINIAELQKAVAEMLTAKVIAGYAPLLEKTLGMVAQAENSVLVDKHGQVFITTRTPLHQQHMQT